jgi:hypothetical protein
MIAIRRTVSVRESIPVPIGRARKIIERASPIV